MADDVMTKSGDHLDTKFGDDMRASVAHFLENSKVRNNGLREVSKGAYVDALKKHNVTEEEVRRVQHAIEFENTAAVRVAAQDLETKISESSKDDLANDDYRRGLSSTVRLPTFGGSTEVTVYSETSNPIPFRGEGDNDGPKFKLTHGRVRTTVNTKKMIHVDVHTEVSDRIRKALGITEADVD